MRRCLERKRDDMRRIRAAVLQIHTSIESVLDEHIMCRVLEVPRYGRVRLMPSPRGKCLRKLLMSAEGLGFDQKLDLAISLRLNLGKETQATCYTEYPFGTGAVIFGS